MSNSLTLSDDINLDKLIDYFVEEGDDESEFALTLDSKQSQIHNYAKAKIRDKIVTDIKDEVKSTIIEEHERSNKKSKFNQVVVLIVETVVLAFLVGLLVNQLTDLISFSKGVDINLSATLWWILGITIILVILIGLSTFRIFLVNLFI